MIKSMTGFGRGEFINETKRIIVETKTVNHRYIDISVRMPRDIVALEEKVQKLVKEYIHRGKTDIFITVYDTLAQVNTVKLNENLVGSYIESIRNASKKFQITDDITASSIFKIPEAFTTEKNEIDLDEIWDSVEKALSDSLKSLVEMREREGHAISHDMMDILSSITIYLDAIKKRSVYVPEEYKAKLEARLKELLSGNANEAIDKQRLATEVAIFADRCSIDEEISRLGSHIKQSVHYLTEGDEVGRKMDFLIQEMNREVNTIGSKANDGEITTNVIALKSEIEKLREQIQNIE